MTEQGSEFPEFQLSDQDGRTWSKKDLTGGRFVVFCYPKDNTSG